MRDDVNDRGNLLVDTFVYIVMMTLSAIMQSGCTLCLCLSKSKIVLLHILIRKEKHMTKSYLVQDFSATKKNQMHLAGEHIVVFYTEMIFILLYKLL